jgi:RNA polymerase sigma factor (sigma-70 family)
MRAIDQFYLDSYGRVPLLTAKEEIVLARAIQKASEPGATLREKRAGIRAKKRMIQANMRLAVNMAMKFLPRCSTLDLHDLVQEAAFGINLAAEKFDPERGYKFSTYAYWWIWQILNRAITSQDRSIRIPVNAAESLAKMFRLTQDAAAKGKPISEAEAAKAANIPLANAHAALLALGVHSLNYMKHGIDTEIIDLLEAPASDDYFSDLGVSRAELLEIVNQLPTQEAYVVGSFFGLHGEAPQSLTRIGKDLGINRQVVTLRKDKALNRIRRAIYHTHGITA